MGRFLWSSDSLKLLLLIRHRHHQCVHGVERPARPNAGQPLIIAGRLGTQFDPVYVDGKLQVTLRGDSIVPEFLQILDDYVEEKYKVS